MADKILIIKPSSLGDIVHALPAVAAVRQAQPRARITWLINSEWTPILRGNPDIDHVHVFPRSRFRGLGGARYLLPWLVSTRRLRPDVALDFQGLLRSALMAKASGARKIFGLSDAREGSRYFYDVRAQVEPHQHAVDRYLRLAETFGAPATAPLRFPLPSGDPLPRFEPFPGYVVLHPFARGRRKSLSRHIISEFCRQLQPHRVVVIGKSHKKISPPENCVNLTNQTSLLQMIWLLRHAAFVISVDSGPMHIAAAVSPQLVSIHTWSDPRRVGPYNPNAQVWRAGELTCFANLERDRPLGKGRPFRRQDVAPIAALAIETMNAQPSYAL
ncbi:MAG: glycosyltransferase family 9 protein [Verrucomicrobiota bacterium]